VPDLEILVLTSAAWAKWLQSIFGQGGNGQDQYFKIRHPVA